MTRTQVELAFNCHILSWAEPTDGGMEFRAITPTGQLVVADTLALLILGLTDAAPYLMAA